MKKLKITIEITNLVGVSFVSGIQRVTREIVCRLLLRPEVETALICYDFYTCDYFFISAEAFLEVYLYNREKSLSLNKKNRFSINTLGAKDIFFDIDSVWNNQIRRSYLLPILKKQGVKIAVHIYDIIPVLFPAFCDEETTYRFLDYLGAHLLYADLVIANTQSTLKDVEALAKRLEVEVPELMDVVQLGSNFINKEDVTDIVCPKFKNTSETWFESKPFLLVVGTIEPRKNHRFLLTAFHNFLKKQGIRLVFAGRPGWNVEELMLEMSQLSEVEEDFRYFSDATDEMINYLYRTAFFTVFPTQYEGFGLPIIESLMHGTPVLATNIPVLREVGGEWVDYFQLDDGAELKNIVTYYLENPEVYLKKKAQISEFMATSWDESEAQMCKALARLA